MGERIQKRRARKRMVQRARAVLNESPLRTRIMCQRAGGMQGDNFNQDTLYQKLDNLRKSGSMYVGVNTEDTLPYILAEKAIWALMDRKMSQERYEQLVDLSESALLNRFYLESRYGGENES
ncbi:hypothetical protein CMI37_12400 [Candidatus Pacearchaeota archaeon]|nr:hypothetical protein [Candidatus Pacearchaeota archaeon]